MLLRSLPTSKRATHNVKRLLFITPLYFVHTILSYLSSISTNIHTSSLDFQFSSHLYLLLLCGINCCLSRDISVHALYCTTPLLQSSLPRLLIDSKQ
ncbi:hypothetical protein J3E69DRAFT_320471 [Trichoderma sp. SZMC 28015]